MSKRHQNSSVFLDRFSQRDVILSEQRYRFIADYFWEHYSYFAHQRSLIFDELKQALANNCSTFKFSQWQRVVNYQYSLDPLSIKGSILNSPGGRFNIGDIDQIKFPRFGALYLAEDRETAYREKFGLFQKDKREGLSAEDLLLTSNSSIAIVTLKGEINQVLNLNNLTSLKDFFNLIKSIKLPDSLVKQAKKLNINPMYEIKTMQELSKAFFNPNWREIAMFMDIPAPSQILGQIAHAAGIEAILYPSKISKKQCLAVFAENFSGSESFIEIEDNYPAELKCGRLDAQSYKELVRYN